MLVCLHARLVKGIHSAHTAGKNAGEHIEVEEFAKGLFAAGPEFQLQAGNMGAVGMKGGIKGGAVKLGKILFIQIVKAVINTVGSESGAEIRFFKTEEAFKNRRLAVLIQEADPCPACLRFHRRAVSTICRRSGAAAHRH